MTDYIPCAKCGRSILADWVYDGPDRTVKLGRCDTCKLEAAVTIPRLAS